MSARLSQQRRRAARAAAALLSLSAAYGSGSGTARAADDQQKAEDLFDEGRKLMQRRSTLDQGCAKLEESLRLWDRGDTVLNLALCHRMQGKTATAWVEFDKAITHGIKVRFPEAIQEAKKQRAELGEKLSRLTVTVSPETAKLEGLKVEVGPDAWARERWNTALVIDPGPKRVKASAKGYKPFEVQVVIGADKDAKTVVVALEKEPPPKPEAPPPPPPPPGVSPPKPVWPWIVGGIGLALGAGAIAGEVMSAVAHSELDNKCGATRQTCPSNYDFGPARTRELVGFGMFLGLGAAAVISVGAAGVGLGISYGGWGAGAAAPSASPNGAPPVATKASPTFRVVVSPAAIGLHSTF